MARSLGERPGGSDEAPAGPRQCFACGDDNPIGMHLEGIRREGDEVRATLRPRPEYQSYPGMLHGGLSATALDEMMGYAAILLEGTWSATARMEIRFRAPVPYDASLELVGGVAEARGGRVRAWARLHLPDGRVGAESTGLLVPLPPETAERARQVYGRSR
jgi:acyl-coenzyme A thioesterase PaaI-like protein